MKIVNLTPHALNLVVGDRTVTIPPSGTVARVNVTRTVVDTVSVDGVEIPINETVYGEVVGLPDPAVLNIPELQPDTVYIVSALVAQAAKRPDVLIPDDLVRDEAGRVIGARALARV